MQVLHLDRAGPYPATATTVKWRRDPEDPRPPVPETFPLTLERFIDIHGQPLAGRRQEIPMATTEQVDQLERLLETIKLPDGEPERWLAKAQAESWEDFTSVNIQKCIDHCRKKLPQT